MRRRYRRHMQRPTAAVIVMAMVGCAAVPPTPATHTVTVSRQRKVVFDLTGPDRDRVRQCTADCRSFGCATRCPTARGADGPCDPGDTSGGKTCRTLVEDETGERLPGTCADAFSGGARVSCVDHPATPGTSGTQRTIQVFVLTPLIVLAVGLVFLAMSGGGPK